LLLALLEWWDGGVARCVKGEETAYFAKQTKDAGVTLQIIWRRTLHAI
jgi:hypothetical protein